MDEITKSLPVLSRPYKLTRSKLGAVTKVFGELFICDPPALIDLFDAITEKLNTLQPSECQFSHLISYSDKTHHDGGDISISSLDKLNTGKTTDRIVLQWQAKHKIENIDNEISITVRIANPINPLVFLQAALSKSPNDIDNLEFEMGATCVTVNGSGQMFAEEVFQVVKSWLSARIKPHAFIQAHKYYDKLEWFLDQLNVTLIPLLVSVIFGLWLFKYHSEKFAIAFLPAAFTVIIVIQNWGRSINNKMAVWSNKTRFFSVFQITNGDVDAIGKASASAKNNCLKLLLTAIIQIILNVIAGVLVVKLF